MTDQQIKNLERLTDMSISNLGMACTLEDEAKRYNVGSAEWIMKVTDAWNHRMNAQFSSAEKWSECIAVMYCMDLGARAITHGIKAQLLELSCQADDKYKEMIHLERPTMRQLEDIVLEIMVLRAAATKLVNSCDHKWTKQEIKYL